MKFEGEFSFCHGKIDEKSGRKFSTYAKTFVVIDAIAIGGGYHYYPDQARIRNKNRPSRFLVDRGGFGGRDRILAR